MSRPDFRPLVAELTPPPEPAAAFARLARQPHCVFLDSATPDAALGRYSFLAADPFDWLEMAADADDCLGELARRTAGFDSPSLPGLPPFQGGAAGLLGYELGRQLETLPAAAFDEFQCPSLAVGLYDAVVAWDHVQSRAWVVSQGFPEVEPEARVRRAEARMAQFRNWLKEPAGAALSLPKRLPAVTSEQLAPQHAVGGRPGLTSDFSRDQYMAAVGRVIDYICAGDVFQVNLSQRLLAAARSDSVSLYLRLRRCNPAPFAGYFDLGELQIVSASPERFLKLADRRVETRPIKGTRPRSGRPDADAAADRELLASEKDRAENVMIVDLLRNDLSRVCEPDSVRVTQLCRVETYQYVKHLVSAVEGRLRDSTSPIDLVRASFPGGSVTGAPKVRAMEIIAEIEPTARGPYCGSLGYLGFDGSMDLSILIRTITAGRGWWQLPAGGGIVAQSDPRQEYEETWHKAEGMLRALE